VIKVEPPGGDLTRDLFSGSVFPAVNLGEKEDICIDLRQEEGKEIVKAIAEEADAIVENFRPGVLEQYDLEYDSVTEENPDVVYCSITGFGQNGPYQDYPAYDPIVQAMSGLMDTIGFPDRPPARIGASVIDYGTGMNAAYLISAGLQERNQTGEGVHIDVSMFDVAIAWMGYWLTYYSKTGKTPTRAGGALSDSAPNDLYSTGDNDFVYVSAPTDTQFERLCEAIGKPNLPEQEKFETREDRWDNREELKNILEEAFSEYDAQGLSSHLIEYGVPAGPLQDIGDIVDNDSHAAARDMIKQIKQDGETVETAALPFRVDNDRLSAGDGPPQLGENSHALLREFGYSDEEIDRLSDEDVVLD
jgi:crotonobetainyl-CoA:carnitine CoA-transferase CaiB-like acyl-CoA transferase